MSQFVNPNIKDISCQRALVILNAVRLRSKSGRSKLVIAQLSAKVMASGSLLAKKPKILG